MEKVFFLFAPDHLLLLFGPAERQGEGDDGINIVHTTMNQFARRDRGHKHRDHFCIVWGKNTHDENSGVWFGLGFEGGKENDKVGEMRCDEESKRGIVRAAVDAERRVQHRDG